MQLRLISFATCPFVHRATIMLREKSVPCETTYIDLKNKPDWFLKISPRGRVPVLVANEIPIFESAVIMEFLDETHPPRILPEDPFERARQRAWIEVANDMFVAFFQAYVTPAGKEFDDAVAKFQAIAARFEETIKEPFFAGEDLGIVDIAIAPIFFRIKKLELRSKRRLLAVTPKVDAWAQRLTDRRSVREGVHENFDQLFFDAVREKKGALAADLA